MVDRVNRDSETYDLNEKTIASAYERVFTKDSGIDRFSIYDVSKRVSGDIDLESMDIYEEPEPDYDFFDDWDF